MREICKVEIVHGYAAGQVFTVGDNAKKIEMDGTLTDTFYSIYFEDDTVMIVPLHIAIAHVSRPEPEEHIAQDAFDEALNQSKEVVS